MRARLAQEIAAASQLVARETDITVAFASGAREAVDEYDRLEQAHRVLPELRRQFARAELVLSGLAAHDHRWRMEQAVLDTTTSRGEYYDALRTFREALLAAQAAGETAIAVARRVDANAYTHGSYLDRLRAEVEAPTSAGISDERRAACRREVELLEAEGFPIAPDVREVMHAAASVMAYLRVSEGSLSTVARFMRDSESVLAAAPAAKRKR